ncbi:MAG: hypothetical protein ACR2OG_03635 [Gemmatimonadaceae bacterium]
MSRSRMLAVSGWLAIIATPAAAQFTTVVQPPAAPAKQQQQAAARVDSARKKSDSATVASRLTNMKLWVDSAAGVADSRKPVPPPDSAMTTRVVAADSAARLSATPARSLPAPVEKSATFKDGAPAPATGTELPLLALLGSAAIITGAILRRR